MGEGEEEEREEELWGISYPSTIGFAAASEGIRVNKGSATVLIAETDRKSGNNNKCDGEDDEGAAEVVEEAADDADDDDEVRAEWLMILSHNNSQSGSQMDRASIRSHSVRDSNQIHTSTGIEEHGLDSVLAAEVKLEISLPILVMMNDKMSSGRSKLRCCWSACCCCSCMCVIPKLPLPIGLEAGRPAPPRAPFACTDIVARVQVGWTEGRGASKTIFPNSGRSMENVHQMDW